MPSPGSHLSITHRVNCLVLRLRLAHHRWSCPMPKELPSKLSCARPRKLRFQLPMKSLMWEILHQLPQNQNQSVTQCIGGFLTNTNTKSQQAAESLYFQMGGVHLDHFGFETLHWAWKSICISATILLSSPDWNPSQPFPSKAAKVFYTTCWWWAQMLPGSPQALGNSWWV